MTPRIFTETARADYDFTGFPLLVRMRSNPVEGRYDSDVLRRWGKLQSKFIGWTRDRSVFSEENVRYGRELYDGYFAEQGLLTGSVLDIGGGWGLFREWWQPRQPEDVYVVHDPGVQRFLAGAHAAHRQLYARAFGLPMTFVEGFGEDLPYRENTFDVCLISAAIDHCIDPVRVLEEVHRCLVPGGSVVVLQHVDTPGEDAPPVRPRRTLRHILKRLASPRRLLLALYYRLTYRDPHLHHFTAASLEAALRSAGYAEVDSTPLDRSGIRAFRGSKAAAD
jgi:ubiquinone/menaquinone biosynthesis C-methylase UbiE